MNANTNGEATPDEIAETLLREVDQLWSARDQLQNNEQALRTVEAVVDALDRGAVRVARVAEGKVIVEERARRAILLAFRLWKMIDSRAGAMAYRDRVPLKAAVPEGVRMVPGSIARRGSYLAPGVVLMPSFVNIGAFVDQDTMVDTWATVGSCAQVGRRVHLAGGAGIGGVLEPASAVPVVIEDDVFVGSRAMVVEGARIETGAKLGAGVLMTGSTRVFDAETGHELERGVAPAWSVCISAARQRTFPGGDFFLPCLLVIKRLEVGEQHNKLAIQELFRQHGVGM